MRLLLLPGLGADRRLFDAQRACTAPIEVIEWIEPHREESLADYAKRLAATIDTSSPFLLGGASFGGMVALEMARHVRPRAVVLIGSCRSPRTLPWFYRPLAALAPLMPIAALGGLLARVFGAHERGARSVPRDARERVTVAHAGEVNAFLDAIRNA